MATANPGIRHIQTEFKEFAKWNSVYPQDSQKISNSERKDLISYRGEDLSIKNVAVKIL